MNKTRKLNLGQRELRAAVRFFKGDTPAGKRWLRIKRANRLAVLNRGPK
jgi:hypothetical protein